MSLPKAILYLPYPTTERYGTIVLLLSLDFVRFLEIVLPHGGQISVTVEAYFDESGTHARSPFLCVAGYLFEASNGRNFDADWRSMLADFNLPFFHRAACEIGEPPFDKLDDTVRRAVRTRAARIIMTHATAGIVVSVEPRSYEKIMPRHKLVGDAYTFCANGCFHGVKIWADKRGYEGKIAYFFEAGANNQGTANDIMSARAASPVRRQAYRYQSHSFLLKEDSTLLQAADILAWHWRDQCLRASSGDEVHPDFVPLIDNRTTVWHFRDKGLFKFAEAVRETVAEIPDADPFWEDRPYRETLGE